MSDRESQLADEPFSFATAKSGKVLISHRGKQVTTLQGLAASKFVMSISGVSAHAAQLLMARATGQFKFGNEREAKTASRQRGNQST